MASTPLVSVIVPGFNHFPFLDTRLRSIFGQTLQDIEVILLDDCSTDGSDAIFKSLAGHPLVSQVVVNGENSGSPFAQWHKGLCLARGKWIWIAESDDDCCTEFLETLISCAAGSDKEPKLIYAQSEVIDHTGAPKGSWKKHTNCFAPDPFAHNFAMEGMEFLRQFSKTKNVIPNASAVLFDRQVAMEPTLWKGLSHMKMAGDWLFWNRLSQRVNVFFLAEPLNRFRFHALASRNHDTIAKKRRRLLEEVIVRSELKMISHLDQTAEVKNFYHLWNNIFGWEELWTQEFSSGRILNESKFTFAMRGLMAKVAGRISLRSNLSD